MIVKTSTVIQNYDHKDAKGPDGEPVTLKSLIAQVLNAPDEAAATWDGENRMRCYSLCVRVYENDPVDLSAEERTFITERAKKVLFPLYLGRLIEALADDPPADPAPDTGSE